MSVHQPTLDELIKKTFASCDVVDTYRVAAPLGDTCGIGVRFRCKTCRQYWTLEIESDSLERLRPVDIGDRVYASFDAHVCQLELGPAGRP